MTVLGFGQGNYQDGKMQSLANKGNGNHAYIDGLKEAKKVLINEMGGTLFTIAKDVKLQLVFNPALVQSYRLIGYENRMLATEDFDNDAKDAGELGSGHVVTALYEIVPATPQNIQIGSLDVKDLIQFSADEMMVLKLRYKQSKGNTPSQLIESKVRIQDLGKTAEQFNTAIAAASFGLMLRKSIHRGATDWPLVVSLAEAAAKGNDPEGHRREMLEMVRQAQATDLLVSRK